MWYYTYILYWMLLRTLAWLWWVEAIAVGPTKNRARPAVLLSSARLLPSEARTIRRDDNFNYMWHMHQPSCFIRNSAILPPSSSYFRRGKCRITPPLTLGIISDVDRFWRVWPTTSILCIRARILFSRKERGLSLKCKEPRARPWCTHARTFSPLQSASHLRSKVSCQCIHLYHSRSTRLSAVASNATGRGSYSSYLFCALSGRQEIGMAISNAN